MIQHVRLTGLVLFFTLSIAGCQFTNSHYSTAKAIHNNGSRVTVKASKLNLRQCPSHKCRILQVLDHGEALTVLSQKDIWLEVKRQKDGTRGWLSSKYVISREKSSAVQTKRIKTQVSAPSPIKNREQVPQNVAEDSPPKPEISTSAMLEEEITVATEKRKSKIIIRSTFLPQLKMNSSRLKTLQLNKLGRSLHTPIMRKLPQQLYRSPRQALNLKKRSSLFLQSTQHLNRNSQRHPSR